MSGINLGPTETNLWRIVAAIIALARGASNAVGTVTLRAGQTTTTVTPSTSPAAENVSSGMQVFLQPKTANAAAVIASTYISDVGSKSFTITHPSDANADKTFGWKAAG
jgi:hypothetical protein